jgi:hypothetical protein
VLKTVWIHLISLEFFLLVGLVQDRSFHQFMTYIPHIYATFHLRVHAIGQCSGWMKIDLETDLV